MVSPARVEGYLTLQPEIGQAMAFGDRRPYLVAVIVPKPQFVEAFAQRRGAGPAAADLPHAPELHQLTRPAVARGHAQVPPRNPLLPFIHSAPPFSAPNAPSHPTA